MIRKLKFQIRCNKKIFPENLMLFFLQIYGVKKNATEYLKIQIDIKILIIETLNFLPKKFNKKVDFSLLNK